MTRRYAVYFAPEPGSLLENFGRRFIGRDHVTGAAIDQLPIDGIAADDLQRYTRSARHYGFHATLKAPFALKDGQSADALHEAAAAFAARRAAFEAPPLQITCLSRWIAFTLAEPSAAMDELAADCVRDFEPFRAALSESDIERRRQSGLSERQDAQLLAFGYPHIFEDFHFHMTLAGPLDPEERADVLLAIRQQAADLESKPLEVDAIAIYEQADRSEPFIQTARLPFRPA